MVMFIKDIGKMIKRIIMDNTLIKMELNISVIGVMIYSKVRENNYGMMDQYIKVIFIIV